MKKTNENDISSLQIQKIVTMGKKNLGMDLDEIRLFVFGETGIDSISSLSKSQGHNIIKKMHRKIARASKQKNVIQLKTLGQKNIINDLIGRINSHRELINLEDMSKRMYGKSYSALTLQETQGFIQALKSIVNR